MENQALQFDFGCLMQLFCMSIVCVLTLLSRGDLPVSLSAGDSKAFENNNDRAETVLGFACVP